MSPAACCTCASALGGAAAPIDDKTEKPLKDLSLSCCGRMICAKCIDANPRLATYCPFCQKTRLDRLPSLGEASAQLPPPYTFDDPDPTSTQEQSAQGDAPVTHRPAPAEASQPAHPPPSYSNTGNPSPAQEQNNRHNPPAARVAAAPPPVGAHGDALGGEEVTHFLAPQDTMTSLSLAYCVPAAVLRSHNKLHADHLLSARRKIGIPRSHYSGASLSPHPVEGEEESERKARLRRFMVRCKCADYKMATLYLEEHTWDLDAAVSKWWDDERWEREHPMPKHKVPIKR